MNGFCLSLSSPRGAGQGPYVAFGAPWQYTITPKPRPKQGLAGARLYWPDGAIETGSAPPSQSIPRRPPAGDCTNTTPATPFAGVRLVILVFAVHTVSLDSGLAASIPVTFPFSSINQTTTRNNTHYSSVSRDTGHPLFLRLGSACPIRRDVPAARRRGAGVGKPA